MKRSALVLAALVSTGALAAQSVVDLFHKAKAQVRGEDYKGALATLDALDAEAGKPGNEHARQQLQAPEAFYRGVCEASLDQTAAAVASFQAFLELQPTASIDPSMYSKKAVAAFAAAQKAAPSAAPPPGEKATLFTAYQEFKPPPNISEPASATWAEGPVQWIMTAEEKKAWAGLTGDGERVEFVDKFWESRNPTPGSADNAYRTGFERRVAFADARFVQDEKKRGSLTDRGMVFVVLGPPTYGGRRPIKNGEDSSEALGMSTLQTNSVAMAQAGAQVSSATGRISSAQAATIAGRMTGPGTQAAESNNNYQEVWHYRKEVLPKNVSYLQVDVVFVTRHGYGSNVLQRDPTVLTTLDAAKKKPH
ncbi:MAG TPA: GWxTD domain-containing protein [Thermoanaerobaculia bacterium]|nr:GWxTD domain-containing protein [Thermoanaerobaculia bacterium]